MMHLFFKGGPLMWPLLVCSIVVVATTVERLWGVLREQLHREPASVRLIFDRIANRDRDGAREIARGSRDFVVRVLGSALEHGENAVDAAIQRAASIELKRFNTGLAALDTIVTLSPLLGLLGTITGMIRAFGLMGDNELGAPQAITGGIAEALIATAFGLAIAIMALVPLNVFSTRLERARLEIEEAVNQLELIVSHEGVEGSSTEGAS
jgi:biopolymer transport protein ExbB